MLSILAGKGRLVWIGEEDPGLVSVIWDCNHSKILKCLAGVCSTCNQQLKKDKSRNLLGKKGRQVDR